jgi:hypothetical protein
MHSFFIEEKKMEARFLILLSIYFYGATVLVASESGGAASGGEGAVLSIVVGAEEIGKKPSAVIPADGRGAQAPALPQKKYRWVKVEGDYMDTPGSYCHMCEEIGRRGFGCLIGLWAAGVCARTWMGDVFMNTEHPYHVPVVCAALGAGAVGFGIAHCVCGRQRFRVWVEKKELDEIIARYDAAEKAQSERLKGLV